MDRGSLKFRLPVGGLCFLIGLAVWIPMIHLPFRTDASEYASGKQSVAPIPDALLKRHVAIWKDPERRREELDRSRLSNPEWDFMWRTFLAWSLVEAALREPDRKAEHLALVDEILEDTLRWEAEKGFRYFLLGYARPAYRQTPERSLFVDGELALTMAMRCLLEPDEALLEKLETRLDLIASRLTQNGLLCVESYPDECWFFDHAVALAAMCVGAAVGGRDRSAFIERFLETAREKLVDSKTGLFHSAYTLTGYVLHGPEGSTLWFAAHMLRAIDPELARELYETTKRELERRVLGFGLAREWPVSHEGSLDIDSGAVIPIVDAGAGSCGLAFVAAASFGDEDFLESLLASLHFAAFPMKDDLGLRYAATNLVGDAALLYGGVTGAAWERVNELAEGGAE